MDKKSNGNSEIETAVLNKAKAGDIESFEKVILAYERKIFNYIFGIVRQRQDAEDLAQETFIKVYKSRKSINPDLNFRAWLYKIATNTTRDWFRKRGNQFELFLIDELEGGFETIDGDSSYNKLETTKDLESALNALKPEYRIVLLLFYWQGFSYEEISSALSLPINTVKTHIHRAKRSLKEILLKGAD